MNYVSKKSIVSLSLVASLFGSVAFDSAQACTQGDDLIGSICVVTYTRGCPSGYVAADGRQLPIAAYQALYSLIGATFGGDGMTYFNVPDLRGRVVVGVGTGVGLQQVSLGQKRGQESVALAANNIPAHTHAATFTATTGPQSVTIPAQTVSGSITAMATTDVVPGAPGSIDPLPNIPNYYLTGVAGGTSGPVTLTPPDAATKSTLIGTKVTIDSSTYKSATAAQTVNITTVTGGTVAVGANTTTNTPVATLPPELGLTYCIATTGLYPMFD